MSFHEHPGPERVPMIPERDPFVAEPILDEQGRWNERHQLNDPDDLARLAHIKRMVPFVYISDADLRRAREHAPKTHSLTAFESGIVGFMVGVIVTALILFGFHYHVI